MSLRRILIVTRNLPPLVGGMERLNWHMAEELAKVAEVRVIGPQGAAALAPAGVIVREAPLKPLRAFLRHARKLARRESKNWRPHLVLAGSGLTAPLARSAARVCGARTAVYVHGLDVAVKHPVYRAVWLPAIRRMDRVIANSHPTAELCRAIGIDSASIGIVHPGVDLPTPPPIPCGTGRHEGAGQGSQSPEFRARHGLENRSVLLSVGRLSARKGLREFVTESLPRIVAAQPDVVLVVVGGAPKDALQATAQTPDDLRAAAATAGVTGHLRFLGQLSEAELLAAYRAADVHVFPIRHLPGNPEGFGMVAVEAAAHGLPTVAFATDGVIDAVKDGVSGMLVTPNDYLSFANAVTKTLSSSSITAANCAGHARQFAWPRFGQELVEQLRLTGFSASTASSGSPSPKHAG